MWDLVEGLGKYGLPSTTPLKQNLSCLFLKSACCKCLNKHVASFSFQQPPESFPPPRPTTSQQNSQNVPKTCQQLFIHFPTTSPKPAKNLKNKSMCCFVVWGVVDADQKGKRKKFPTRLLAFEHVWLQTVQIRACLPMLIMHCPAPTRSPVTPSSLRGSRTVMTLDAQHRDK